MDTHNVEFLNPDYELTYTQIEEIVRSEEWQAWIILEKSHGDTDHKAVRLRDNIKECLFKYHENWAAAIAAKYTAKLPYSPLVDGDDLRSGAFFGLWQAIHSYSTAFNTAFRTHAHTRVSGAVVDEMRKLQNCPRNTARARRELAPLIEELSHALRRKVTFEELPNHFPEAMIGGMLGIPIADIVHDKLLTSQVYNQLSNGNSGDDGKEGQSSCIEDTFSKSRPQQSADYMQRRAESIEAILLEIPDPDQKMVFYQYYWQGYTLPKMAKITGKSTSWLSSRKRQAIEVLKKKFKFNPDQVDAKEFFKL